MDLNNIKNWLKELLHKRFNVKSELIYEFSYLDLFYLYLEVYKNFNVKLSIKEITDENLSLNLLADYIYNRINTSSYF